MNEIVLKNYLEKYYLIIEENLFQYLVISVAWLVIYALLQTIYSKENKLMKVCQVIIYILLLPLVFVFLYKIFVLKNYDDLKSELILLSVMIIFNLLKRLVKKYDEKVDEIIGR